MNETWFNRVVAISPERLIDGCVETLRDEVLPNLEARTARGRLYAVMDVLQNLRDRVDPKAAALEAEATSARTALGRIAAVLREAGSADAAGCVEAALAAASTGTPSECVAALRQALVAAIDALYALPSGAPEAARRALGDHLGPQAVRDIAPLKPSLLNEISKG
ncbi:MAG: hypothetical protein OEM05_18050 [Myxococcales bacterium]|nr:hypothetical protein [Myxococcales bacterium]